MSSTHAPMQPGEVRITAWDQRKCRVLGADEIEVLYDAWWSDGIAPGGAWGIRNPADRANYYRVPTSLMLGSSEQVGHDPLSVEEHAVHRPDLPLRVLRKLGWRWSAERYAGYEELAAAAKAAGVALPGSRIVIDAPEIVIAAHGPKGALKRGERISADDGRAFGALQLLFKAHQIQAKHVQNPSAGAGIYRLGCQSGLPSFYVGGDRDLAGFLKD